MDEVEGIQYCHLCGKLIQKGQAWSPHQYDNGYTMYYHYACNKQNKVVLIPLTAETARTLYNYLRPLEPSDVEDWRMETIRSLENTLGE